MLKVQFNQFIRLFIVHIHWQKKIENENIIFILFWLNQCQRMIKKIWPYLQINFFNFLCGLLELKIILNL